MFVSLRSVFVSFVISLSVLSACTHEINDALIRAAKNGDLEKTERLLATGADINFLTSDGSYALEAAVSENHPDVVRVLLAKGAKLHQIPGRMTPPEMAASQGNVDIVSAFLDSGYNANAKQAYGYTLLHIAAQEGQRSVISLLVKGGAEINARDSNGATPIFHAVGTNHASCVQILLDAGANPNILTTDGNCPLTLALAEGHSELVAMLKKMGARTCR